MKAEYEQMELDTRPALLQAITAVTNEAVSTARELTIKHNELAKENGNHVPGPVHNRHEAYGIAAEQMGKINKAVKSIKGDAVILLGTLSDPNKTAVEAVSDIYNSTLEAAIVLVIAAAEMKRTMQELYDAETFEPRPTPMDELASGDFQEAEDLDPDEDPDADTGDDE